MKAQSKAEDLENSNDKLKCGLVMPISAMGDYTAQHWIDVKQIICEALAETDFSVEMVSAADDIGVIQARIVKSLYHAPLVICDVSGKNPNVMFELGIRLAFDKPAIIIKDEKTSYNFDIASIEHIEYPLDLHYQSVVAFKNTLRGKVIATYKASQNPEHTTFLKHFGDVKAAKIEEREVDSLQYVQSQLENISAAIANLSQTVSNNASRTERDLANASLLALGQRGFASPIYGFSGADPIAPHSAKSALAAVSELGDVSNAIGSVKTRF